MHKKIKKILTFFFATYLVIQSVGFLFLESPMVSAASDIPKLTIPDLQIKIPGLATFSQPADACVEEGEYMKCSINWLSEYISGIYKYGIGIVGILATVVMMFGGFLYLTAAGDKSRITEAKEWIKASLTGLVIAMSSYMILYQVNPELINLKPLKITMIKPTTTATSTGECSPTLSASGKCTDCYDCSSLKDAGIPTKDGFMVTKTMITGLKKAYDNRGAGTSFTVTEAWPPVVAHASAGHANGKAADVGIVPWETARVMTVYAALQSAGFNSLQIETADCSAYPGLKCNANPDSTGNHIHVNN